MNQDLIIQNLKLSPHAEGGWYRRTYTSKEITTLKRGERSCGSTILYFLKCTEFSRLHFLRSDEVWYFHWGSPLKLHLFSEGTYKDVLLGTDLISNQHIQYIIEAGTVFGAETTPNGRGSLVSCSVTPGFNELDFHWVETNEMIGKYPEKRALIRKLIR